MTDAETITLTDLARLAGVGRNAVSNWRRRESDFPKPVDDSTRRPRFALADVERWAAEHGRTLRITAADRLWFSLSGDFASPDHALRAVAAALSGGGDRPDLARRLEALRGETHEAGLFEFFVERAREAAGTGEAPGIGALVDTAAACAPPRPGLSVFDPACGEGDLLTALVARIGEPAVIGGKDLSATHAVICEQRLRLARPGAEVAVAVGDSLLTPLPERRFDLVVCDPPFNLKDWGYDRLPAGDDPRLAYGTPPRTEPELAWALHCLALLAPGGTAAVRMPAMVAHRRSGRRIRSELLRWGALRAVVDHPGSKAHIWVLAPRGQSSQLLVSTGGDFAAAWRSFTADPHAPLATGESAAIPVMRLWDEDVDITPAVYLTESEADAADLAGAAERLAALLDGAGDELPRLVDGSPTAAPETSLADLERDGLAAVRPGGAAGAGRAVIVDPVGVPAVRLGPAADATETQWTVTCDPEALDLGWLAAALAARLPTAARRTATGAKRRLLAVKVPRLPLAEQRRRGRAFERLLTLRDTVEQARAEAAALVDESAAGLVSGTVTVDDQDTGPGEPS